MEFIPKKPPRTFDIGRDNKITINDCGAVRLQPDELLSFLSETNREYDIVRKDWGYYATPSVNSRLKDQGFKVALVSNKKGQVYVMIVDAEKMDLFENYCQTEEQKVLEWLDERKLYP